ncbi:hypothetical protein [Accumulibacter sp.]|uniref:hypothetical protein n=1 Tax=Accumulibacter sp. TaxID=2053492 RepID=UPI002603D4A1|nr:hypothetical protein [Accumulibacter sp.]
MTTIAVTAALLVLGFMFSVLALAVVLIVGLLAFAYLKWKTRHLRASFGLRPPMDRQRASPDLHGDVIEGEVIARTVYDTARGASASGEATNDFPAPRRQRPLENPGCRAAAGDRQPDEPLPGQPKFP